MASLNVAWEMLTNAGTLQNRRVEWQTTIIATSRAGDRQWEYVVCLRRLVETQDALVDLRVQFLLSCISVFKINA